MRLRSLEEAGVIERRALEYTLTEKGQALMPLIEDMRAYGRDWLDA